MKVYHFETVVKVMISFAISAAVLASEATLARVKHRSYRRHGGWQSSMKEPLPAGSCSVTCGSSEAEVVVDLAAACMCIGPMNCFRVGVGMRGSRKTYDGIGTLGENRIGKKFRTYPHPTTKWDKDSMRTFTKNDNAGGRWIHKAWKCANNRVGKTSLGCIEVPCEKWLEVRAEEGKSIDICNQQIAYAPGYRTEQYASQIPGREDESRVRYSEAKSSSSSTTATD